jgi:LEA14-like dessication related protein
MLAALQLACSSTAQTIQPPRIELVGLAVLAPEGAQRFRVSLLLSNPNAEAVPIEEVRFSVRVAGEGLLMGESTSPLTLAPRAQETMRVDVDGALMSSVSRLVALTQGPQSTLSYEIAGDVTLAKRRPNSFPFNSTGQVPFVMSAAR